MSCRICFETKENEDDLFSPCLCSGSNQFVHRSCLNKWRQSNYSDTASTSCPTCKYNYRIVKKNSNGFFNYFSFISRILVDIAFFAFVLIIAFTLNSIALNVYFREDITCFQQFKIAQLGGIYLTFLMLCFHTHYVFFINKNLSSIIETLFPKSMLYSAFLLCTLLPLLPIFTVSSFVILLFNYAEYAKLLKQKIFITEYVKDINDQ